MADEKGVDQKSAKEAKDAVAETTRLFQEQLKIVTQMRDVMSQMAGNIKQVGESSSKMIDPDVLDQAAKKLDSARHVTELVEKANKKTGSSFSPLAKAAGIAGMAVTGIFQAFKNVLALGKGLLGFLGSVADGLFSVGKSILSIPFKMFDGLIKMAKQGGGGNELRAAYEEVRKEFGDLNSASSKAITDTAKSMDKMNQTGIPTYQVFGNLAERIKAVKELAVGLGPLFSQFQDEIHENGTAIMMYQKGLGLTNEQMQSLASNAQKMGKGIAQVQNEMTKQALGMSKAFGLNAKTISKDMAKAMADLAHFGHLSSKEMAVTAAFAQKLGVSVDKLTGIMDATNTFDQTAEGMSKLNEQFSTNIDFTEMMSAQTAQEKVAMLSKEFARAGVDIKNLNKQERDLIKQNTQLDDTMLNAMASHGDMSDMLNDLNKQAEKNENKTLSQAEAMKELANSIDRLTQSGSLGEGGIFAHIMKGFGTGLQSTKEFRDIMHSINIVLREAFLFGKKLGEQFVKFFPGVKEVFEGLSGLFDPARYRKMFSGVLSAFDVFKEGGTGKMEDFMTKLKEVFFNFFNDGSEPGKKLLGGFSKFGEAMKKIIVSVATWAWKELKGIYKSVIEEINKSGKIMNSIKDTLKDWIAGLSGWIKEAFVPFAKEAVMGLTSWLDPNNVKKTINEVTDTGKNTANSFLTLMKPLGEALSYAWKELKEPLKKLAIQIVELFKEAMKEAWDTLSIWEKSGIILSKFSGLFAPALSAVGPLIATGIKKMAAWSAAQWTAARLAMTAAQTAEAAAAGAAVGTAAGAAEATAGVTASTAAGAASGTAFLTSLAATISTGGIAVIGAAIAAALYAAWSFAGTNVASQKDVFKKQFEEATSDMERVKLLQEQVDAAQKRADVARKFAEEQEKRLKSGEVSEGNRASVQGMINRNKEAEEKYLNERAGFAGELAGIQARIDKQAQEERRKKLQEQQQRAIDALGEINLQNATEKFQKIDEMAKNIMGPEFDVAEKLKAIREKFNSIDFTIMSPEKNEELLKATDQLMRLHSVFNNISEIGGLIDKTVQGIDKINDQWIINTMKGYQIAITHALTAVSKDSDGNVRNTTAIDTAANNATALASMFSRLEGMANSLDGVNKKVAGMPTDDVIAANLASLRVAITNASVAINMHDFGLISLAPSRTEEVIKMFDGLKRVHGSIQSYMDSTKEFSVETMKSGMVKSLLAVTEMVKAVQQMDNALSNLANLQIDTRLASLTNKLGIGSAGTYTVTSKDVVINVSFNVTMDAGSVEGIVIGRSDSVIRDRINFLLDNTLKSNPSTANALIKTGPVQSSNVAGNVAG